MPCTDQQKAMYAAFMEEFKFCMACGRDGRFGRSWCLPGLDNAHIRGGEGRTHDRRNLLRLCKGCHMLAHGENVRIKGELLPWLDLAHLLWIKLNCDKPFYDKAYLNSLRPTRCPRAQKPPEWFFQ